MVAKIAKKVVKKAAKELDPEKFSYDDENIIATFEIEDGFMTIIAVAEPEPLFLW